jgi:iron complex outermembrane receptor protein
MLTLLALASASLCVSDPVIAQGNDSPFEEITVTATKREQSIFDVPVAMTAFSADTIERKGITDLTDVGKFVPNLNVTGFSAGHTSSVNPFIRGIGLRYPVWPQFDRWRNQHHYSTPGYGRRRPSGLSAR